MPVVVRRLAPEDWPAARDVRLAALLDAPEAFASTYEREAAFAEQDWRARLGRTGVATLHAELDGRAAGTATLVPGLSGLPDVGDLVGMWVAPAARGRGVGDALVDAALALAWATGCQEVRLIVVVGNEAARRLYERHGFNDTGDREPMPERPHLIETTMTRPAPP